MGTPDGRPRSTPTIWRNPLFLACMAFSLGVPLFYFDWVVVDIFLVSKDEQMVSSDNECAMSNLDANCKLKLSPMGSDFRLPSSFILSQPSSFRLYSFPALLLPRGSW
jgi:hypothetical protein